ncbi:MAG TPA: proprotein convertase P-domain-containing protein, partial [Nannocystaceae bacterium]|nr:proprotein convertase P-domain-containing protein [Nannocystaceae bacterium]
IGNVGVAKPSLDAGAAEFYTDAIPNAPNGEHVAYAVVDTDQVVAELDENNNVSLGFAWTNTPDLVYTSFGAPSAPLPIPDRGTVESTIDVQAGVVAPEVWVSLNVTYPDVSELQIDLVAPDGQTRTLVAGAPAGANFGGTTFRDDVGTTIELGMAPFVGEFEPMTDWPTPPVPPTGDWTLRVSDMAPGNAGAVNDWSVTIRE